jgi:hypothetical protein
MPNYSYEFAAPKLRVGIITSDFKFDLRENADLSNNINQLNENFALKMFETIARSIDIK